MTSLPLKEAIARLPIPVLWQQLGLPGRVTNNCVVRSPLRDDDRHPSFSIFDNGRKFKDHGRGWSGDSFTLYQLLTGMDAKSAWRPFVKLAESK
jgi:hypothetical protein